MQCSNPNVDPDLTNDPLLDTYHIEGCPLPEEMQSRRTRRKQSNQLDFAH